MIILSTGLFSQNLQISELDASIRSLEMENIHFDNPLYHTSPQGNDYIYYLDSVSVEEIDPNSLELVVTGKELFIYDSNNFLTQRLRFDWDFNQEIWTNRIKTDYKFNENHHLLEFSGYYWLKDIEQWEGTSKQRYARRFTGELDTLIYFTRNDDTQEWDYDRKLDYTFDENGILTQSTLKRWNSNDSVWTTSSKTEYLYDSLGNNFSRESYPWIDSTQTWGLNTSKIDFTYDSLGKEIESVRQYKNGSQFVNSIKLTKSYDLNQVLSEETYSSWDTSTSAWELRFHDMYENDANGNRIYDIQLTPGNQPGQLINNSKTEQSFEGSISFSNIIPDPFSSSLMEGDNFQNLPLSTDFYIWNRNTEDWSLYYNKNLFYKQIPNPTSVNNYSFKLSTLYPNPVTDNLSFSFAEGIQDVTFDLFDVQGRLVLSREIESSNSVNLESIKTGIYFYRLTADGRTQTGKVIKN